MTASDSTRLPPLAAAAVDRAPDERATPGLIETARADAATRVLVLSGDAAPLDGPAELVPPVHQRLEPPAQDLSALARSGRRPLGLLVRRRRERGDRVVRARVRDLAQRLTGGGVTDRQRGPAAGVPPLSGHEQLLRDRVDDSLLVLLRHTHSATLGHMLTARRRRPSRRSS